MLIPVSTWLEDASCHSRRRRDISSYWSSPEPQPLVSLLEKKYAISSLALRRSGLGSTISGIFRAPNGLLLLTESLKVGQTFLTACL